MQTISQTDLRLSYRSANRRNSLEVIANAHTRLSRRRKSLSSAELAADITAAAAASRTSPGASFNAMRRITGGGHFPIPEPNPGVIVGHGHRMTSEEGRRTAAQHLADLHSIQISGTSHGLEHVASAKAAE